MIFNYHHPTLDAILVEQVSAADATWVLSGVLGVNLVLFISCLICMFHLLYQKGLRLKLFLKNVLVSIKFWFVLDFATLYEN